MGTYAGASPASGINSIVQTIVALKDLQLRSQAQDLARQQFGLQQQEYGLRAHEADVGEKVQAQEGFQRLTDLIRNTDDPLALGPFVNEFANRIGVSPESIATIIAHTPPATETTRGRAVAEGAAASGGSLNAPAASQALAGLPPGALSEDALTSKLFGGAGGYYSTLSPQEQQGFSKSIVSRLATGISLSPGQAALDEAVTHLTPAQRLLAVQIGHGLAPSASEQDQIKLGWAAHFLQQTQISDQAANESLRTQSMIAEAQARVGEGQSTHIADLLRERDKVLTQLITGATTMTPEGRATSAGTLNAYNETLRRLAPSVFGPNGSTPLKDVKPQGDLGIHSNFLDFLSKSGLAP